MSDNQFYSNQPIQFMEGLLNPSIGFAPSISIAAMLGSVSALSSYSFSVDIGAAHDNRAMAFAYGTAIGSGSITVSSATIAGVSLTKAVECVGSASTVGFLIARVPASVGSGVQTFTANMSAAGNQFGLVPMRLMGLVSISATHSATSTADPASASLNIANKGMALACARCGNVAATYTWGGVAEDFDQLIPGSTTRTFSGGHYQAGPAETGRSITANRSLVGNGFAMAAVSFR